MCVHVCVHTCQCVHTGVCGVACVATLLNSLPTAFVPHRCPHCSVFVLAPEPCDAALAVLSCFILMWYDKPACSVPFCTSPTLGLKSATSLSRASWFPSVGSGIELNLGSRESWFPSAGSGMDRAQSGPQGCSLPLVQSAFSMCVFQR